MRNQPKYNFFKNTIYALKGLKEIISCETSFKIELIFVTILLPVIYLLDLDLCEKLILFISLMGVLIAEAVNSAIERVVDLVTLDHHHMAEKAKDIGSSVVFLSIFLAVVVWAVLLYKAFF